MSRAAPASTPAPAPAPEAASTALARVRELSASARVLVLVYYRGLWDPFCMSWGRGLAHMRSLPGRLDALQATVVFVSSQHPRYEAAAADEFHFGPDHAARRAGRVHFVNDELLELVDYANAQLGGSVSVIPCDPNFAGGYKYRKGIVQPSVMAVAEPWTPNTEVVSNLSFKPGDGGPNGDVLDRPPACSVIRRIESAILGATAFAS